METLCPVGHKIVCRCYKYPQQCSKCKEEQLAKEKKLERDRKLELDRQEKQRDYARRLAKLDEEIELKKQALRAKALAEENELTIRQKEKDLASLTIYMNQKLSRTEETIKPGHAPAAAEKPLETRTGRNNIEVGKTAPIEDLKSANKYSNSNTQLPSSAKEDWKRQKEFHNVQNESLDSLMDMIGLEDVKQRFLDIKAKIDLVIRQNTDLKNERFGAALLGNPGTGLLFGIPRVSY